MEKGKNDIELKEKQKKIEELEEKCNYLEDELKIEKERMNEKEIQWDNERKEKDLLISEFLEPKIKKFIENEELLKKEIAELKKSKKKK